MSKSSNIFRGSRHTILMRSACCVCGELNVDDIAWKEERVSSNQGRQPHQQDPPNVENASKITCSSTSSPIPPTKIVFLVLPPSSMLVVRAMNESCGQYGTARGRRSQFDAQTIPIVGLPHLHPSRWSLSRMSRTWTK
jgi:hypothetical protein